MKTPNEIWGSLAQIYEDKFMDIDLYHDTYDEFCSLLQPKAAVLELGCGPGNISKFVLQRRPDLTYLGTDYAAGMVEKALQNVPKAQFQILDAKKLSTLDQIFDGIIAGFILPFFTLEEAAKLIRDCHAKLNPDGILYLSFEKGNHADSHMKKGSQSDQELFFHYYSITQLRDLLQSAGFKILKEFEKPFERPENKIDTHIVMLTRK